LTHAPEGVGLVQDRNWTKGAVPGQHVVLHDPVSVGHQADQPPSISGSGAHDPEEPDDELEPDQLVSHESMSRYHGPDHFSVVFMRRYPIGVISPVIPCVDPL
jgi:hypothetical protein